jgi:ankyrin repeat protein
MNQADLTIHLYRAFERGDMAEVQLLLAQGADINGFTGCCALENAVEQGDMEAVYQLLELGADPSRGLHAASTSESVSPILRLLLQQGANANLPCYEGITPLFLACGRNGTYSVAKLLLESGADPNHRCADGDTPLMWAAYQRDWHYPESPLTALLDAGADPNILNDEGGGSVPTTALIWAAGEGHWVNVRTLLFRGADPNIIDCTGMTALLVAASGGHIQIVRDLLEHGADPAITDSNGATARQLAERHCSKLLDLLSPPLSELPT